MLRVSKIFKEINNFIQQRCIKLIKNDSKDFNIFSNAVLLNCLFIKESWKMYDSFHKSIKQHNYF